jgi:hypothetical protein
MFLILPPSGKHIIEDPVSERIAYAPLFGLRAISLCFSFCLRTAANYTKACVRTDSLCFFIWPPGGKFMFLILPSGGKLIIEDQVSERIAYAPLFGLRAVSLCFSFCLWAGSLL